MQPEATIDSPKPARAAYTLSEFAALFGREQTWAYRMKYRGKIKVLPSEEFLGGGDMVPHSEVERLLSKATNYSDEIAGERVPQQKKRPALSKTKAKRAAHAKANSQVKRASNGANSLAD